MGGWLAIWCCLRFVVVAGYDDVWGGVLGWVLSFVGWRWLGFAIDAWFLGLALRLLV